LDTSFRLDYAHFWAALISGKESAIEERVIRLFSHDARAGQVRDRDGIHYHRMFASMLTGRPWDILERQNGLLEPRAMSEKNMIHTSLAKGGFYLAISDVLAALPTDLLLVLKTNDLLRLLETSLGNDQRKRAIPMYQLVYRTGVYSLQTLLSYESWLSPSLWNLSLRLAVMSFWI
jgi:aarF domain-containing kinase